MKTEKSCDNCIYSIPDWTNVCNSDHYCSNQKSEGYGYNVEYLNSCDEWKSIEPNLGNNGSICTKTGSNDEDRTTDDCISRKQAIEAFEPTHYKDWYTPTIIETLETLPSVRPEVLACGNGELVKESDGLVNDLVKDCIGRQVVAKWLERWDGHVDKDIIERMKLRVIDIPSAQPTFTEAEIQRMQDLESAEIEKAYQLGYEEGKKERMTCDGCKYANHPTGWSDVCVLCIRNFRNFKDRYER